jgi:hypothetical protein
VNGGADCDGARREVTPEIGRVLMELTRLEAAAPPMWPLHRKPIGDGETP